MELPQIRIQSKPTLLGLNITKPVQEIEQRPAEMEMTNPKLDLFIETKPIQIQLDSTEARADLELKSVFRSVEDAAGLGYEAWLEGIARMSSEGDAMMNVQDNNKAIESISQENANPAPAEIGIKFVPRFGSMRVSWIPNEINIDWKETRADLHVKVNKPIHNYTPGRAEAYIRQEGELNIDYTGVTIDIKK